MVPYNLHILGSFFLCLDSFCENDLHHTQPISGFFGALCPKSWHLKHRWITSIVLNSSTLKIILVFWHTDPPEMSVSACFVSSHLILIKGRSLPDLLDFIRAALTWVILMKSSSSLKSSNLTLLKTKTFPLWRLQNDKTLVVTP